jgi:hypothetical protein
LSVSAGPEYTTILQKRVLLRECLVRLNIKENSDEAYRTDAKLASYRNKIA